MTSDVLLEAVHKAPELLILVWMVRYFLKHMEARDRRASEAQDKFHASLEKQRADFKEELREFRAARHVIEVLEHEQRAVEKAD